MRSLHLMIKPASGLCNMRCHYCFYADETSKRETASLFCELLLRVRYLRFRPLNIW